MTCRLQAKLSTQTCRVSTPQTCKTVLTTGVAGVIKPENSLGKSFQTESSKCWFLSPQATVAWNNTTSRTTSLKQVGLPEKLLAPSPAAKACAPLLLGSAAGQVQPLNCWSVTRDRDILSVERLFSSHCTKKAGLSPQKAAFNFSHCYTDISPCWEAANEQN